VNIGFLSRNVGNYIYNDPSVKSLDDPGRKTEDYIIAGSVGGFLFICLLVSFGIVFVMVRKRKLMKKEKAGLLYKMDKIEAKFRNQCREGGSLFLNTNDSNLLNSEPAIGLRFEWSSLRNYYKIQ
jgi:hypothetical protein